jgi:ribosomal protein L7/L12
MNDEVSNLAGLIALGRRMRSDGKTIEQVLAVLRAESLSIIDSIRVIRELTGMSLREAKQVIHNSATWMDVGPAMADAQREFAKEALRHGDVEISKDSVAVRINLNAAKDC